MASLTDIAFLHGLKGKSMGLEVTYRCPNHYDTNPSLCVNDSKDAWFCFSCHRGGYGAVSFLSFITGISISEAELQINGKKNSTLDSLLRRFNSKTKEEKLKRELKTFKYLSIANWARTMIPLIGLDKVEITLERFDEYEYSTSTI
jgi:DNA primase